MPGELFRMLYLLLLPPRVLRGGVEGTGWCEEA